MDNRIRMAWRAPSFDAALIMAFRGFTAPEVWDGMKVCFGKRSAHGMGSSVQNPCRLDKGS
jgi:hypothetical protein